MCRWLRCASLGAGVQVALFTVSPFVCTMKQCCVLLCLCELSNCQCHYQLYVSLHCE